MNTLINETLENVSGGYEIVNWLYAHGPFTAGRSKKTYWIKWNAEKTVYGVFEPSDTIPVMRFNCYAGALLWIQDH